MRYSDKINELYKSGKQKELKRAFDLFEAENWTLKQIIEFVIENHKVETTIADLHEMVDSRTFQIGPLHFKFVVHDDWEPLDVDTYYKLVLYLSLRDINDNKTSFCVIENIQTEQVNIIFTPEKEETPSFIEKMNECTWKVFEKPDLQQSKKLYNYLNSFYTDFCTQINKKEIKVY